MNKNYTYTQIATNYELWLELVDIDGNMDRETFDATPVAALVVMMTDMFGMENVTVEICENNVWATDAKYTKGGWETGAALSSDEDEDDAIYAQIEDALEVGDTRGTVGAFTWRVA